MPASLDDSSTVFPSSVSSTKAWWLFFSLLAGLLITGRALQPAAAPKALVKRELAAPVVRTTSSYQAVVNAPLAPAAAL